jgi:ATP-dependent Clp protease ATP-binding subunit ClpA
VFERFTQDARTVVVVAQEEARRLHHPGIGTAHLLLALMATDAPAADLLRERGVTCARVEQTLHEVLGTAPGDAPDTTALAALGIDLDRIREAVEAAFGPGALERAASDAGACRSRRRLGRRTLRLTAGSELDLLRLNDRREGHLPFGADAKKTLELSLREALRLGDGYIGTEHLVLGLLRGGDSVAAGVLHRLGVDAAELRQAVEQTRRRSA